MAKPAVTGRRPKPKRFPWLLFVLLLASIYVLWLLPYQLGPRPIKVDFEPAPVTAK